MALTTPRLDQESDRNQSVPARAIDFARSHVDLLLCAGLTLLAAVIRLYALGGTPAGIHGDEAQVGLDARRVLSEGWIGPYTLSALGQPSGHAYLTAPAIWLFGSSAWTLRLPLALTGIAAIPLAYVLFRMFGERVEASFAVFLLATSLWHLHFSRVAHWPISYVTLSLGVLILWTLAMRKRRWYWFAAAGALLGLGLYTYNIYPIFVVAFAVWVGLYTLLHERGERFLPWARQVGLAAAVAFVVGLPLFLYIADPSNHYFEHYDQYYREYSILRSEEFQDAGVTGKAEVIARQAFDFAGAYAWSGVTDFVDGASPDGRPMIDAASLLLALAGLAYAAWHWRETRHLLVLCLLLILPLPAVLQTNATYRGPLGLAPWVAFLAAIPLALTWREAHLLTRGRLLALRSGVCLILALIAYINLHAYFGAWAGSDHFDDVYARSFTDAVQFADGLPGDPYVYFLSEDFSFENHDTPRFLTPDLKGEDRSTRFYGTRELLLFDLRPSVFLLMDDYLRDDTLTFLRDLYPYGEVYERDYDGRPGFVAYVLPEIRISPP